MAQSISIVTLINLGLSIAFLGYVAIGATVIRRRLHVLLSFASRWYVAHRGRLPSERIETVVIAAGIIIWPSILGSERRNRKTSQQRRRGA